MSTALKWKKMHPMAHAPKYGSAAAAGMDLHSCENYLIRPGEKCLVRTGIAIEIPEDHYGRIAPRSGLASNYFIDVGAGVVDQDYRGEVMVLLFNFSKHNFQIFIGDRIAQLICERISRPEIVQVDRLSLTIRNANGFGSTQ